MFGFPLYLFVFPVVLHFYSQKCQKLLDYSAKTCFK